MTNCGGFPNSPAPKLQADIWLLKRMGQACSGAGIAGSAIMEMSDEALWGKLISPCHVFVVKEGGWACECVSV